MNLTEDLLNDNNSEARLAVKNSPKFDGTELIDSSSLEIQNIAKELSKY